MEDLRQQTKYKKQKLQTIKTINVLSNLNKKMNQI